MFYALYGHVSLVDGFLEQNVNHVRKWQEKYVDYASCYAERSIAIGRRAAYRGPITQFQSVGS